MTLKQDKNSIIWVYTQVIGTIIIKFKRFEWTLSQQFYSFCANMFLLGCTIKYPSKKMTWPQHALLRLNMSHLTSTYHIWLTTCHSWSKHVLIDLIMSNLTYNMYYLTSPFPTWPQHVLLDLQCLTWPPYPTWPQHVLLYLNMSYLTSTCHIWPTTCHS